jgi:hypothetical protein
MAVRGNFTKEELKLLGLAGRQVEGILDTPEKARELREEVEREVEPELRKLDRASGESQAKASRYPIAG